MVSKSQIKFMFEDNDKCIEIVKTLLKDENSKEFREPVDWKKYGLYNYPKLITNPMDLGTLKKRLKKAKKLRIKSLQEFFENLQLIWKNCKFYNLQDSVSIKIYFSKFIIKR